VWPRFEPLLAGVSLPRHFRTAVVQAVFSLIATLATLADRTQAI